MKSTSSNATLLQPVFSQQIATTSRDDQAEPSLPDFNIGYYVFPVERAISWLQQYWTEQLNSDNRLSFVYEIERCDQEVWETKLVEFLGQEPIHNSLQRIRSHQIDIELQFDHESALHAICILIELIENAKRDAEEKLKNNIIDFIKTDFMPSDQGRLLRRKIRNYSGLLRLLPQLYQVREFISLPSILNRAETVELSHFLYLGGCFKKGVSIAKIRKDVAQMCGIVASELTLNTIASDNQNKRTPLLLIKKCMKNWEMEQEKIERVKTERERSKRKK